ncbi:MAG: hypothetical protein CL942_05790 [Desulfovibrio sp.]|nr:hypothetical protein [Desulfovibrio sp.]|tara:strand:- start:463 stop:789 length:327 start_codon:yes stop_codon:yes gene_type:complete
MKTYIREGTRMPFTNSSGSSIPAGTPILVDSVVGVAVSEIKNGETGYLSMTGVHKVPVAAVSVDQGAKAYWDDTNKVFTNVDTGNTLNGYFTAATSGGSGEVAINTMN